jgi:tetratricopeptide (TPR) repeat protein
MSDEQPAAPLEEDSKEYKKALLYIKSGDLDKAREILEEYCAQNPRSARAFNKWAYVLLEMGNVDAAEKVLAGLLHMGLRDFYSHFLYGRVLMKRGHVSDAVAHFTTALTINPRDAYTLNAVAEAVLVQGDRQKALRCLRKAIEISPADIVSYISLARLYLDAGSPAEAVDVVKAGLAQQPKDPTLLFLNGRCLLVRGEETAAKQQFDQLAEWYPGLAFGRMGLGLLREAAGDLPGAVQAMTQATTVDTKSAEALERLAILHARLGDKDKALVAMEKSVALAPEDLRLQTAHARALYERKLILKAWLRVQLVLTQDQAYFPARVLVAMLYLDEGIAARADEELLKVLEKEPGNEEALGLHGEAKAQMGKLDEAQAIVKGLEQKDESLRQANFVLALVTKARGDEAGYKKLLKALDGEKRFDRVAVRVKKLLG